MEEFILLVVTHKYLDSKMNDISVDVLVIGSGNGGMTAALSAHILGLTNVLVIEKDTTYGGTSAMSGGGLALGIQWAVDGG